MVHKTILVKEDLKKELDKLKIHKKDSYGDVIEKLIKFWNDKTHLTTKANPEETTSEEQSSEDNLKKEDIPSPEEEPKQQDSEVEPPKPEVEHVHNV